MGLQVGMMMGSETMREGSLGSKLSSGVPPSVAMRILEGVVQGEVRNESLGELGTLVKSHFIIEVSY